MSTITIARADITGEEVAVALRSGLGPRYSVRPGMRIAAGPWTGPRPADPDAIVVSTRADSVWRAQVSIEHGSHETSIHVRPSGLLSIYLVNLLGIARKVHRVLRTAPSLNPPPA